MYKYTFVLFAFLMGALALQAQSYQTSFTYEDAPDSLKNSVFSKDGKRMGRRILIHCIYFQE